MRGEAVLFRWLFGGPVWIGLIVALLSESACARADSSDGGIIWCWNAAQGGYSVLNQRCDPGDEQVSNAEFRLRRESAAYADFAAANPESANATTPISLDDRFEVVGSGTAFFVSDDGYLPTNKHVVEGCDLTALVASDNLHAAMLMDTSDFDLALLKVDSEVDSFAVFTTRTQRVGENVYAIGYPLFGELTSITVTEGIISSLSGPPDAPKLLQVSAPIQPGNSGGPLVDQYGTIAGVVSSKFSGPVGESFLEGVAFAIKPLTVQVFMLMNGVEPILFAKSRLSSTPDIVDFVTEFTYPILCMVRKKPAP
jgi:serine protease Do